MSKPFSEPLPQSERLFNHFGNQNPSIAGLNFRHTKAKQKRKKQSLRTIELHPFAFYPWLYAFRIFDLFWPKGIQ